ncbi:MAG TPA: phosphate uptake regulator PhoU [Geobacterales bacterium]|nr:phosphate uptake regulator PhoU [Geobacterales bacterium]
MVREIRSLQVTGGETYIVSLPKNWIKSLKLNPHDKVVMVENEDSSLAIYPAKLLDKKTKRSVTLMFEELMDENTLIRECIGSYLAGYTNIKIIFDKKNIQKKAFVKNTLRDKLIGIEVIEEGIDNMTIQVFAETKEAGLIKTLNRLFSVVFLMLENLLEGMKANLDILKEVSKLDDEVDRFYHFITRQINLAIEDPYSMLDLGVSKKTVLIEYRLFSKTLERIADHISLISKNYVEAEKEIDKDVMEELLNIGSEVKALFMKASNAFLDNKVKMARENALEIEEFIAEIDASLEKITRQIRERDALPLVRMILESFRRIAEYSMDICELAINIEKLNK